MAKDPSCSPELLSLACGPSSSASTYPACIVNGVKFLVHERDKLHTTQSSGVSTPGPDGAMYYGQLEEILELTYMGNRKVVLFRCIWFDTRNPTNPTPRSRRSYIEHGIHHILTERDAYRNQQYILATQATQVFYLEDPARRPPHWKVVEDVHHRKIWHGDVVDSYQDVIHGSSSSDVALSVGLTGFEYANLSVNDESAEVDAPPDVVAEEDADFVTNEDNVVAHVLDDDDVDVSDDDEVNPTIVVEEVLSSDDSDYDN